jgi:hypothetical protein
MIINAEIDKTTGKWTISAGSMTKDQAEQVIIRLVSLADPMTPVRQPWPGWRTHNCTDQTGRKCVHIGTCCIDCNGRSWSPERATIDHPGTVPA